MDSKFSVVILALLALNNVQYLPSALTTDCLNSSLTNADNKLIKIPLKLSITPRGGKYGPPVITYYTPISIGTPLKKTFNVQFEVGYGITFVPKLISNRFKRQLHFNKGFNCNVSSTCTDGHLAFDWSYLGCKISGHKYYDRISFDLVSQQVNLPQETAQVEEEKAKATITIDESFMLADSASDSRFSDLPIDGIIQMGPMKQSEDQINNPVTSMQEAKLIDRLQFSLWFSNDISNSSQAAELICGGIDESRYEGPIQWHKIEPINKFENSWSINIKSIKIGDNKVNSCMGNRCHIVLASGSRDILGPEEDVKRIYTLLEAKSDSQNSDIKTVDCANVPKLPDLTITISDGLEYKLNSFDYIKYTSEGSCYVAIMPTNSEQLSWTLGLSFLTKFYSIFDLDNLQVGLAKPK